MESAISYVPKVLIVDDEPRMCDSLEVLLSDQGYETKTGNSGKEAVECLSKDSFDLVLLDIVMPDMTGHQIMDFINSQNKETLVILMTGHASVDSAVESLRKGAYDYLTKPFDFEQLVKRVGNAIDQSRLKKEHELVSGKLELTEKRYQYLVNASPDIIYTLNGGGIFTFISGAIEPLLGFKSNELIGKHYSSVVYDDDLAGAKYHFDERRTGQRATRGVELRLKRLHNLDSRNGGYMTVELKAMGIYDRPLEQQDKEFRGTYGVARDITDRKRLEAQLLQAQKMKAIGTLAGGIAHDFNNLLMGIEGHTSLMFLDIDADHPHSEHVSGIEDMVKRGAHLTKQLLGFARGGKYEVKPTDMNDLVEKSAEMFGRTKKEIRIHTKCEKDVWTVSVDRAQIEQVLLNLYVNAWQAMPAGGDIYNRADNLILDENAARTFGARPGNYVRLSVTDTGVGIDEEAQHRIFEPFFTTREVGRGTGLGLASAYGIIKNHGGIINVYSVKGQGTTFTIYLPSAEGLISEQNPEEREKEIQKGHETLLLVDDEAVIIGVGEDMLTALGYEVMLARSGQEAIGIYEKNKGKIAMVILDMIMPDMNGGDAYDILKKIDPNIMVLLSSGYSIDGQASEILERGCDGFIQKPFSMSQLSEAIRKILDQ
ncbi:MAG: response regulator [Deltaproteobacteria bacterium]|nr:response regulator [Deltaproteobacteria bacterium]